LTRKSSQNQPVIIASTIAAIATIAKRRKVLMTRNRIVVPDFVKWELDLMNLEARCAKRSILSVAGSKSTWSHFIGVELIELESHRNCDR
jgi:hypothetical protein